MRYILLATLIFGLSGCISGISYGDIRHGALSAGPICNPESNDPKDVSDKPLFVATSRMPDCRNGVSKLTGFRGDKIRYGRFSSKSKGENKNGGETPKTPLAFQTRKAWWADLALSASKNDGRVLLYVHGYRETFDRSSRDSAQIERLTKFPGPIIQYSWPSQGELLSYAVDETNMYWDERNFRGFLQELAEKPWVKDVTLVSHSLGARLVIPSIEYVDRANPGWDASTISNIILAAPDTDRGEFERDIGGSLLSARHVQTGRRMTIYVSMKDKALGVSRTIHGYPRLGRPFCFSPLEAEKLRSEGWPERCYPRKFDHRNKMDMRGLTIIDTTEISNDGGHSDYLRSANACRDFAAVVKGKDNMDSARHDTHLPYVFTLAPYGKGEKPDHEEVCEREK